MFCLQLRRKPGRLAVVGLAVLALGLAGCPEKKDNTGCGNGLLGIGEECDCGSDPNDLPTGCVAINGAPGSNCSDTCTDVVAENCDNSIDDDDDELVDCADPDCDEHPRCLPETVCNDAVDNDGDGHMDCDDPDCSPLDVCLPEDCTNGTDDNADGFIDCQDAQCLGVPECEGVEVCWGGVDDDGDGYTDCDDSDCTGQNVCQPEDCANGLDDDGDFKIDCADRSCIEATECAGTDCTGPLIDQSVTLSLAPTQQVVELSLDIASATDDSYGSCDVSNGAERVLELRLAEAGRLRVVYGQTGAHRFGLYFKGGAGTDCVAAMSSCTVPAVDADGVLEYGALPASEYFLVISEGSAGSGGQVDLVITLVDPNPANAEELCDNLLDDDTDGQVDCGDLECYEAAGVCDHASCTTPPDVDYDAGWIALGTNPLHPMPGDDPQRIELDTSTSASSWPVVDCLGAFGPDQVVKFSLGQDAVIQVGFRQDMAGAGDHVLALFFKGQNCDLAEHECMDPGGALTGVVTFPGDPAAGGVYPPGEYYLVVKTLSANAGRIDLQIITMDPLAEICDDDGFDNDGDGAANCDDSDCATHHICVAEDCSANGDVDQDLLYGCDDTDPDDGCVCAYSCACYGQGGSCVATEHVCDPIYDDDIIDFGVTPVGTTLPFDVTTDATDVRADYDLVDCHGSVDSTAPDLVFYFTLDGPADVEFDFQQDAGADHVGLLMAVDRCRACDDPGPADAYKIFCYYTTSSWLQPNLPAGDYALILKPTLDASNIYSGRFHGDFLVH